MEALVASMLAVVWIGIASTVVALQIVGLQLATNLMQPEEELSLATAALVWLLGGVAALGASCGLSVFALCIPMVGVLIPPAATVAVYSFVLASFAKLDLSRAFLAVLMWTLAQALLGTAIWAVLTAVSHLMG